MEEVGENNKASDRGKLYIYRQYINYSFKIK